MTFQINLDGAPWFQGSYTGVARGLALSKTRSTQLGSKAWTLGKHGLPIKLEGPAPWLFLIPFETSEMLESLPSRQGWQGAPQAALFWQPLEWSTGQEKGSQEGPDLSEQLIQGVAGQGDRPMVPLASAMESSLAKADYLAGIEKLLQANRQGEVYQANLSQIFQLSQAPSPREAYASLCQQKVRPDYASLWQMGSLGSMISWSPERLLRCEGRALFTDPIAGTRRTDPDRAADEALQQELKLSAKEQAEHAMLVDLLRNDLGKVAKAGSVQVPDLARVESHGYVHHIVSTVTAQLDSQATALDALWALFPGGTISGVPKISALKNLVELEKFSRGVYTGSAGIYWPDQGFLEANILIRTFFFSENKVNYGAGGGIVTESLPEHEYQESLAKAAPLFSLTPSIEVS